MSRKKKAKALTQEQKDILWRAVVEHVWKQSWIFGHAKMRMPYQKP